MRGYVEMLTDEKVAAGATFAQARREAWMEVGGEVFAHGKEGFAAPQTQASTLVDLGGATGHLALAAIIIAWT